MVVVQILEELEVRPRSCEAVTKVMMELDVLHSLVPRFESVIILEHSIAKAASVALRRPHSAVSEAMIEPILFIREIPQAVKEIERAFKTTANRRRHLHDTTDAGLQCPLCKV